MDDRWRNWLKYLPCSYFKEEIGENWILKIKNPSEGLSGLGSQISKVVVTKTLVQEMLIKEST